MARKKHTGTCHICGKFTNLSFEHVPPRKAFNANSFTTVSGEEVLFKSEFPFDFSKSRWKEHQGGIGGHTLCETCNNLTGRWYAPHFISLVRQAAMQSDGETIEINSRRHLGFKQIFPLRIAKQIVTCFASINSEKLFQEEPMLKNFVLNKESKLSSGIEYGLYIYFLGRARGRSIGRAGAFNIDRGSYTFVSEFSHPPLGYILEFAPKSLIKDRYCDITFFTNQYALDEQVDITLNIPTLVSDSPFPTDHRTKEQLEDCRKSSNDQ